jgi:hypothetical protein
MEDPMENNTAVNIGLRIVCKQANMMVLTHIKLAIRDTSK